MILLTPSLWKLNFTWIGAPLLYSWSTLEGVGAWKTSVSQFTDATIVRQKRYFQHPASLTLQVNSINLTWRTMRWPLYVHSLPSHTNQSISWLGDESPDTLWEVANISCPGACNLPIIFLGHLLKRLRAKYRASAEPRWFELKLYKEQLGWVCTFSL